MSRYVTTKRVAAVRQHLTAQEWAVLRHLHVAKLASGEQLRRLDGITTTSERRMLRRRLQRLTEQRVVTRLDRRVGGVRRGSDSYVYAIDVLGQRILHPDTSKQRRRPWTPSVRVLEHSLAVTDLYVRMIEADRAGVLELVSFATEPSCWRTFTGPGGGRLILKPDAHCVIATGDVERHAWIELDRATESLPWIAEKAKSYGRYFDSGREQEDQGVFPEALWIAPTPRRAEQLAETLSRLTSDQWQLHRVTTTDDALHTLAGEDLPEDGDPQR